MKVSFIINEPIQSASGGYKMVYIYANELVNRGHDVTIYYHCHRGVLLSNYYIPFWMKMIMANILAKTGPKWFELDQRVGRKVVQDVTDKNVSDGDIVIATAANTAGEVFLLDKNKGKKAYFVQGYEDWVMSKEELENTYRLDMEIITVSKWLQTIIQNVVDSDRVNCVLNGIRNDVFYIINSPETRSIKMISMLYHDLESKGSKEGIYVLNELKKLFPDLKAHLFGVVDNPGNLPSWIDYTHNADQNQLRKIYNDSMIYLSPSWNEGFGLTGAEAMMCGAVLVSTKTDGVKEYSTEENAFWVDVHDTKSMIDKCVEVITKPELRNRMAIAGSKYVAEKLCYEKSVDGFIGILERMHKGRD